MEAGAHSGAAGAARGEAGGEGGAGAAPAVEFRDASFSYDGETPVIDGVSLAIERGSFTCVLGGNGSGKSTLAKLVCALLVPDEGRVSVFGRDTADRSLTYAIRSDAGLVFQNPDDQLVASIVENDVAFGPENLGIRLPELRIRVTRALESVGLAGFEKRETETLSGGQKQRVAVAGVLAMAPKILVLDEATSMLDPQGREGLLATCERLHKDGMTVVMITHFMDEAARADRVIALEAGRVALDGAPSDVLCRAEELRALGLDVPFATALSRELAARGVPVRDTVSDHELEEELCRLHSSR